MITAQLFEVASELEVIFNHIQGGIVISGVGLVAHELSRWLSTKTNVAAPDPTIWKRLWEGGFNELFHPIGLRVLDKNRKSETNLALYQLVVSIVAMIAVIDLHLVLSGITLGALVASYSSIGVGFDATPIIETFASICLLMGMAATFHAAQKNIEPVYQ